MEPIGIYAFTHSGATYLLNIFLELNLCIYRGKASNFWTSTSEGNDSLDRKEALDLGVWFPRMQKQREYQFSKTEPKIFWSHDLPEQSCQLSPSIMMIRDPVDTLYSMYQRVGQNKELSSFLASRQPSLIYGLEPSLEWALYYHSCQHILRNQCIVRFEDLKTEPHREVTRILKYLQVKRSPQAIQTAIDASAFPVVKAATESWYRLFPELKEGAWKALRKGAVGEGKTVNNTSLHHSLKGFPTEIAKSYHYKTEQTNCLSSPLNSQTFSKTVTSDIYKGLILFCSDHAIELSETKIMEMWPQSLWTLLAAARSLLEHGFKGECRRILTTFELPSIGDFSALYTIASLYAELGDEQDFKKVYQYASLKMSSHAERFALYTLKGQRSLIYKALGYISYRRLRFHKKKAQKQHKQALQRMNSRFKTQA